ncbi:MAG: PAS domain-containing protein [Candidatus Pacebacteria bacterium]|nr:PAS domain-containing protein [Candidatus Paceibacterota bacterium]
MNIALLGNKIKTKDKKIELLLDDLSSLESYIRDLFVFSPLPICFISPLGVILEANPAFAKISNFDFENIIGETVETFFKKQEIEKLTQDTLKTGFVKGREMQLFLKNKENLVVHVFSKARKNEQGKRVGYFLGIFDLTKIKKTEVQIKKTQTALLNILEDTEEAKQRAEEEKNKTQAIITSFTDGLLVFDQVNKLILINPQAESFLKIESKTIIGKSINELANIQNLKQLTDILKKSGKNTLGPVRNASRSDADRDIKKVFRKEWKIRENFILEISTISLAGDGSTGGTLAVLHDISREKLVQKLKTEFVSISAHQLRTPLSAIKWTLKMLLDGDLGKITKEQRDFLIRTYKSNERMISLINSLLNVTRIEEGRFLFKPVLADLEEIIEFAIEQNKSNAKRRKIRILFKKQGNLPKSLIDVENMKLAAQNLVDNAVKYSMIKSKIVINLCKKDKNFEFSIKDTGVGILKAQQSRIFSKFFRGTNAIRMETEGSGLGLFIAKNIIEAHKGKIWFESEKNKGTIFYFTLPIPKK